MQVASILASFCCFADVISNKMAPESASRGNIGSKNEARGGCIGNLRRHEESKSAKQNKM